MYRYSRLLIFVLFGATVLTIVNFQSLETTNIYKPLAQVWEGNLDINKWLAAFEERNADIVQPDVNIEVNGHSIKFKNLTGTKNPDKIRIHLIFHSHVDPGWLRTFEEYYQEKVKNILTNAVAHLALYPSLRFIWSETSFLERWWRDATIDQKFHMLGQIKSGQLEISGGAWVMTDEATPTFYSAIENMIEGHSFLLEQFNMTPKTSWSVDPFGHGSMMPELLHRAGVESMVIGRFNMHLKEEMRNKQALRWQWIPPYFENLEGPRVNSLPRTVYTTPDACENSKICFCYHVGPSALYQSYCPDGQLINHMTVHTLEHVTKRFVDQIRITQVMYGTTDVLVPIGDDFFFGDQKDWEEMYNGYNNMIEWLKLHPEVGAEMRFSTVSEFFDSIKDQQLPTLRGDFFPYTSNMGNEHPWWTGYFVHRPVTKTMERRLQNCLRSLDILSILVKNREKIDLSAIIEAKRQLMLYQHHDGITGTSKIHVMRDYEERMTKAFTTFSTIYRNLLFNNVGNYTFDYVTNQEIPVDIPKTGSINLSVFSSQTFSSRQLIKFMANRPVKVATDDGNEVESYSQKMSGGKFKDFYQVSFFADLTPLSLTTFSLSSAEKIAKNVEKPIKCLNYNQETKNLEGLILDGTIFHLNFELFQIPDNGGAYVIQTQGESKKLLPTKVEHFDDGLGEWAEFSGYYLDGLKMRLICHGEGDFAVEIDTDVSIGYTLGLTLNSNIDNDNFYTDVNGMYHLERKFTKAYNGRNLPWEANIFPVASSSFIQDDKQRLTVITAQPTGAVSNSNGTLQILVDRRMPTSDGKGLDFGDAMDNRSATVKYRILLETRLDSTGNQSFLSQKVDETVSEVLYPPILMVTPTKVEGSLAQNLETWSCGIQLVSWRLLSQEVGVIILRRQRFDATIDGGCTEDDMEGLYRFLTSRIGSIRHTKLSATVELEEVTFDSFVQSLQAPFSIAAFRFRL